MTTTCRGRTAARPRTAPATWAATGTPRTTRAGQATVPAIRTGRATVRTTRAGRAERGPLFLRRLVHAVPAVGRRRLPELGDPLGEQIVQARDPEGGVEIASGR